MGCVKPKNFGSVRCSDLFQYPRVMIETSKRLKFTLEQLQDPEFWQGLVTAGEAFIWPEFYNVTNNSEAPVYQTTNSSKKLVRPGRYEFMLDIAKNMCIHRAMSTHNGGDKRVLLIDQENQAMVTKGSDGFYRALSVDNTQTEKLKFNDGSNVSVSPVMLSLSNSKEVDLAGYTVDFSFFDELLPLTDVDLTIVGTPTIGVIDVAVTQSCDGTPVTGLAKADFVVKEPDGDVVATTALVETSPGVYHITGAAFLDNGTINLVAPTALSIEAYESSGPALLEF